jgi:hypothetical protein
MINKYKGVKENLLKINPAVWLSNKYRINRHLNIYILKQEGVTDKVKKQNLQQQISDWTKRWNFCTVCSFIVVVRNENIDPKCMG